jgi:hypothetical protein
VRFQHIVFVVYLTVHADKNLATGDA